MRYAARPDRQALSRCIAPSRSSITSGTKDLASYMNLGAAPVIRITSPQPSVWLDLWGSDRWGGASGTFNGFDQFGRIIDQRWQTRIASPPADIDLRNVLWAELEPV